jgi:hypothetical protein
MSETISTQRNSVTHLFLRQLSEGRCVVYCWTFVTAHTRPKCVIIMASSQQQWLLEYASIIRYTYIIFRSQIQCLFRSNEVYHTYNIGFLLLYSI